MSQDHTVQVAPANRAPLAPQPTEVETLSPAPGPSSPPSAPKKQRILGVDLARGFALIGMFTAHFGLATEPQLMSPGTWSGLVNGRSSILFAILAGVSLAIITGRTNPIAGQKLLDARFKIIVRAFCIFVLGELLTSLNSYIAIILQTYAVLFIVAVFLLRVRRRWLITIAFVWAVVGPLLVAVWEPLATALEFGVPMMDILVWGSYPVLTWIPYIVIGLAIGRTDLTKRANQVLLLVFGMIVCVIGYAGVLPFASDLGPDDSTGFPKFSSGSSIYDEGGSAKADGKVDPDFAVPCLDADDYDQCMNDWELEFYGDGDYYPNEEGAKDQILNNLANWNTTVPHSGTPFEIFGSGGFAVAFLGLCLLVMPLCRIILRPIIAMGSMSLTIYVIHVVSFRFLQDSFESFGELAVTPWLLSILACAVFATVWMAFFRRGPLEAALHKFVLRVTAPKDSVGTDSRERTTTEISS